ncbi:hypothetical protein AAF712_015944 [Marasmius tenuissimus]|uniref:Uncharacterized protein n=1 Tax=Marasmius tenuissimus TaxID=585030 RepID=A0ABR2ZAC6_9AGAR
MTSTLFCDQEFSTYGIMYTSTHQDNRQGRLIIRRHHELEVGIGSQINNSFSRTKLNFGKSTREILKQLILSSSPKLTDVSLPICRVLDTPPVSTGLKRSYDHAEHDIEDMRNQSDVLTDVLQRREAGEHQDDEDGAKEDTGDSGQAPVTPKSKLTRRGSPLSPTDTIDSIQTTPVTGPFTPRRKRAVDASSDIEATETPTRTIKKAKSTSSISKASASQQSSSTPAPQSRRRTIGDQIAATVVASNGSYEATIRIKTKAKAKTRPEIEQLRLAHAAEQAERQRQHEMEMCRMQMLMCAGAPPPEPSVDRSLMGM